MRVKAKRNRIAFAFEVFAEMPDAVLMQLRQLEQAGALSDDVAGNVKREAARRGFK